MKADSYIEEVEKCTHYFKEQLKEEQKEIKDAQEKVLNLLSGFFQKDTNDQNLDSFNQMKISLPNKSVISSLFKDDSSTNHLFFNGDREETKRRQLAAERRSEYNAYLEKKEKEIQSRRHIPEESRSVTPRSILDSVDYEKVLAKLKEEEAKFRNLNHAEPNLEERISKPLTPLLPRNPEILPEEMKPRQVVKRHTSLPKATTFVPFLPLHRTGGGGEPVKDSLGNLITARGFKDTSTMEMGFPSFMQESSVDKSSYREELRRQIEEKKRLEALEKERARQVEEKLAHRIEEQRRKMQVEYEKELQRDSQRKAQLQQERLQRLEEFQKRDAAIRNQRIKESIMTQSAPTLHVESPVVESKRSISPPVPAVRTKEILERTVSPAISSATQVKPENIFSSLAEIRRTIMKDQQNLKKDFKDSYEVTNRRTVPDMSDDYEEDMNCQ